MHAPITIKGNGPEKWDAVQAIQHRPFIYIAGNGSHWAGSEEDDLPVLLDVLRTYQLDQSRTSIEVNPCCGIDNPNWKWGAGEPRWVDGPRLYACDGVVRFTGNFLEISHGFRIDTNDPATICQLQNLITNNAIALAEGKE